MVKTRSAASRIDDDRIEGDLHHFGMARAASADSLVRRCRIVAAHVALAAPRQRRPVVRRQSRAVTKAAARQGGQRSGDEDMVFHQQDNAHRTRPAATGSRPLRQAERTRCTALFQALALASTLPA